MFGDNGYHGSSVQQITAMSGCSRAAFYQYFSSKEDLFRNMAGRVARQLRTSTDALDPIGPDAAGWSALNAWLSRYSEIYTANSSVFTTYQSAADSDREVAKGAHRVDRRTFSGIRTRIGDSPLPPTQIDVVVRILLATVARANRMSEVVESQRPDSMPHGRDQVNVAMTDVFHRALFGVDRDVNVHISSFRPPTASPGPGPASGQDGADAPVLDRGADPTLGPTARRTRNLLLDTAQDVFADRGYHATRVDDIVAAADVSHGIFYRYFDSKTDIFHILADSAGRRMAGAYAGIEGTVHLDDGSVRQDLSVWLRSYVDTSAAQMAIIAAWVEAMAEGGDLNDTSMAAIEAGHASLARFLDAREFGDVRTDAIVMLVLLDAITVRNVGPRRIDEYAWMIEAGLLTEPGGGPRRSERLDQPAAMTVAPNAASVATGAKSLNQT